MPGTVLSGVAMDDDSAGRRIRDRTDCGGEQVGVAVEHHDVVLFEA
jgi:hypothetical protein